MTRRRAARRRQIRRRRFIAGGALASLIAVGALGFTAFGPAATPSHAHTVAAHSTKTHRHRNPFTPLATPARLTPLAHPAPASDGRWSPAARTVRGHVAVYETTIRLPDEPGVVAGVAWMDTKLLRARLYSGSLSPGGFNWPYTAPVSPHAARTLVAAFNGGFLMKDTKGGYYSDGRYAAPLVHGAASLVIYKNGSVAIGAWGGKLHMGKRVRSVRQNLVLLIDHSKIAPDVSPTDTYVWGYALHQVVNTWRSGLGITADGALVYAYGPMNIRDLADVLLRAGAVRAMTLDMNPAWTIYATFAPRHGTPASATNGSSLLPNTVYGPSQFFNPAYARDFVTMSAR